MVAFCIHVCRMPNTQVKTVQFAHFLISFSTLEYLISQVTSDNYNDSIFNLICFDVSITIFLNPSIFSDMINVKHIYNTTEKINT